MPVLHPVSEPADLLPLLRLHLPTSLPVYSALQTPGKPQKVMTTLQLGDGDRDRPESAGPWVIVVDSGNQFRFYCHVQGATEEVVREADVLLEAVVKEIMRNASREGREVVRLGAIPDQYTQVVERVTGVPCISASRIWCDPAYSSGQEIPQPSTGTTIIAAESFEFRDAREEDIPTILSTSEVPHLPSYLSTRLADTTCLFTVSQPASPGVLVAHVTTHRDGSLGTLHVDPRYRRRNLARLVLQHRLSKMRSTTHEKVGYCYVHRENEASRAVMKSLGWVESEENVWWDIVNLTAWEARQREDPAGRA
ncbi:GNAT family N-acetyltransferase [Sporobolomyces koalae]|uniref:GNAT family N-acetyltransferase n=1 Tax=Sporobolomyces koalae TaxID=500713 RepID=UPI0031727BBB